jgi:hypothetical protein
MRIESDHSTSSPELQLTISLPYDSSILSPDTTFFPFPYIAQSEEAVPDFELHQFNLDAEEGITGLLLNYLTHLLVRQVNGDIIARQQMRINEVLVQSPNTSVYSGRKTYAICPRAELIVRRSRHDTQPAKARHFYGRKGYLRCEQCRKWKQKVWPKCLM